MLDKKEICRDVIARIEAEQFQAKHNRFLGQETTQNLKALLNNVENFEKSAQEFVTNNVCEACAKGGLMLSYIRLHNNVTLGCLSVLDSEIDGFWPVPLMQAFGQKLLDEIEVAFEGRSYSWNDIDNSRGSELARRYKEIFNPNDKLTAILRDIIDDKF